jgi:hypothetical protein
MTELKKVHLSTLLDAMEPKFIASGTPGGENKLANYCRMISMRLDLPFFSFGRDGRYSKPLSRSAKPFVDMMVVSSSMSQSMALSARAVHH